VAGRSAKKITASQRVETLRKIHAQNGLDLNDPFQRNKILADSKNDKIKCEFCGSKWLVNKKHNIQSHFDSASHRTAFANWLHVRARETPTIVSHFKTVSMTPIQINTRNELDERTVMARQNYIRNLLIAGLPMNAMEDLREFNSAHYDFSITRTSDMADVAINPILNAERATLKEEMQAAGYVVVGFDGTTHLGEASFFVARYWKGKEIVCKCIAAKHADKSMSGVVLCRLFKAVCSAYDIRYSPNFGTGTFVF
jgi:hypothetical protein